MRLIRGGLALVALAASAGCVTLTPRVPSNTSVNATSGYIGGIFSRETYVNFGFGLRNEQTQSEFVIEIEKNDVGLIAVPPGRYRVANWQTWALTGGRLTKKEFPASAFIARPFDVAGGEVVLLGSWSADRDWSVGGNTFTIVPRRITEREATAAFRAAYAGFADAAVRCVHCAPEGTSNR